MVINDSRDLQNVSGRDVRGGGAWEAHDPGCKRMSHIGRCSLGPCSRTRLQTRRSAAFCMLLRFLGTLGATSANGDHVAGSSADRHFISKARFSPGSVSARVNWLSVLSPEDFIFHAFDLVSQPNTTFTLTCSSVWI